MPTTTDPAARSGAAQGDLWSERTDAWADGMEPGLQPVFAAGLEALGVGAGDRLLDVGCGAGLALALAAARGADVTGLDAAPAMLAHARRRVPGARIEQADLEELPFADASFDIVTGFNSFQYAASPAAALAEARRVLRPGGRVLAAVWSPPEMCGLAGYLAAVGSHLPPPPKGAPGPFALSGDGALARLLGSVGLSPRETADVICTFAWADDAEAARAMLSAGPAVRATRAAGDGPVAASVLAAVAPYRTADGGYRVDNAFRYTIATR